MRLNLDAEPCKIIPWTKLESDVCMSIALAKLDTFVGESWKLAELVRRGILSKALAVECLHEAAAYNQLYFEYGAERVQAIMAEAFEVAAA